MSYAGIIVQPYVDVDYTIWNKKRPFAESKVTVRYARADTTLQLLKDFVEHFSQRVIIRGLPFTAGELETCDAARALIAKIEGKN